MKSPLTFALDLAGVAALTAAAIALGGALWFAQAVAETVLLDAFRYCLAGAIGAFLVARSVDIAQVLRTAARTPVVSATVATIADNVEALPERAALQRAA